MKKIIKIGSRPSDLAITQVQLVISKLQPLYPEFSFVVVPVKTTGDIRRDAHQLNVRDKKEWVIELENKILSGDIDFAIHCAKDVPLAIENGTSICTVLPRAGCFDVLLYNTSGESGAFGGALSILHPGATVGTSSKRRKAQLLRLRPDLCVVQCRGNVPTRVSKLRDQKLYDGLVLAVAGLERLNLHDHPLSYVFSTEEMLPAVGQGVLLAQFASSNESIKEMLSSITDRNTQCVYEAERAFVDVLGADCHSSVGIYADLSNSSITLTGRVLSDDGFECIEDSVTGDSAHPEKLGESLGKSLVEKGAAALL